MAGTVKLLSLMILGIAVAYGFESALSQFIEDWVVDIIRLCGISIILAVGLNVINGMCGQFSLGHAGFMAIGAYVAAKFTTNFEYFDDTLLRDVEVSAWLPGGYGFIVALFAGGAAAAFAGIVIGLPTLRLRGDYLAIATLGFGEIINIVINGFDKVGGASGMGPLPNYSGIGPIFAVVFMAIVFSYTLQRSTYGRAMIAVRENEIAAEVMGINTAKVKILAFVYGAFLAGVAGGLYGHYLQNIRPSEFGFMKSVEIVVMLVFGGLGSITGAIVGAICITVLPFLLQPIETAYDLPSGFRMVIYALILILLMIFRPQGIFGQRELSVKLLRSWLPFGKSESKPSGGGS